MWSERIDLQVQIIWNIFFSFTHQNKHIVCI